ncbi:uncharacterized protein [Parasteatoda tepidariorum]|uniref:uncharacterized protein isoform X2 n=1 Tax=Parasteatoda tepidariorum TaxID=114398 RepID=UPI001C729849|nr:uncharacterized protein LOC107447759 isoform X2 [Parasteatoda tepidariorum]
MDSKCLMEKLQENKQESNSLKQKIYHLENVLEALKGIVSAQKEDDNLNRRQGVEHQVSSNQGEGEKNHTIPISNFELEEEKSPNGKKRLVLVFEEKCILPEVPQDDKFKENDSKDDEESTAFQPIVLNEKYQKTDCISNHSDSNPSNMCNSKKLIRSTKSISLKRKGEFSPHKKSKFKKLFNIVEVKGSSSSQESSFREKSGISDRNEKRGKLFKEMINDTNQYISNYTKKDKPPVRSSANTFYKPPGGNEYEKKRLGLKSSRYNVNSNRNDVFYFKNITQKILKLPGNYESNCNSIKTLSTNFSELVKEMKKEYKASFCSSGKTFLPKELLTSEEISELPNFSMRKSNDCNPNLHENGLSSSLFKRSPQINEKRNHKCFFTKNPVSSQSSGLKNNNRLCLLSDDSNDKNIFSNAENLIEKKDNLLEPEQKDLHQLSQKNNNLRINSKFKLTTNIDKTEESKVNMIKSVQLKTPYFAKPDKDSNSLHKSDSLNHQNISEILSKPFVPVRRSSRTKSKPPKAKDEVKNLLSRETFGYNFNRLKTDSSTCSAELIKKMNQYQASVRTSATFQINDSAISQMNIHNVSLNSPLKKSDILKKFRSSLQKSKLVDTASSFETNDELDISTITETNIKFKSSSEMNSRFNKLFSKESNADKNTGLYSANPNVRVKNNILKPGANPILDTQSNISSIPSLREFEHPCRSKSNSESKSNFNEMLKEKTKLPFCSSGSTNNAAVEINDLETGSHVSSNSKSLFDTGLMEAFIDSTDEEVAMDIEAQSSTIPEISETCFLNEKITSHLNKHALSSLPQQCHSLPKLKCKWPKIVIVDCLKQNAKNLADGVVSHDVEKKNDCVASGESQCLLMKCKPLKIILEDCIEKNTKQVRPDINISLCENETVKMIPTSTNAFETKTTEAVKLSKDPTLGNLSVKTNTNKYMAVKKRYIDYHRLNKLASISPLLSGVFSDLERRVLTKDNLNYYSQILFDILIDEKLITKSSEIIYYVLKFLSLVNKNPIRFFNETRDPAIFLPPVERCIVLVIQKINSSTLSHSKGFLNSITVNIHQLLLGMNSLTLKGCCALSRVYAQICKSEGKEMMALTLCCDLLKTLHKFSPMIIACIAGVWPGLFEVPYNASDEEVIFHSAIALGSQKCPNIKSKKLRSKFQMYPSQFKVSSDILGEFMSVSPLEPTEEIVDVLMDAISKRCMKGSYEFFVTSSIVIFAAYKGSEWAKQNVVEKHLIPKIKLYSETEPNEGALTLFCKLYAEVCFFYPENCSPEDVLFHLFENENHKNEFVSDCVAPALIELLLSRKRCLPKSMNKWLQMNTNNEKYSYLELVFHRAVLKKKSDFFTDDIL